MLKLKDGEERKRKSEEEKKRELGRRGLAREFKSEKPRSEGKKESVWE